MNAQAIGLAAALFITAITAGIVATNDLSTVAAAKTCTEDGMGFMPFLAAKHFKTSTLTWRCE